MKKTVKIVIPVVLVLALLVILAGSLVVTQPDEYTIIKQFGAVVKIIDQPGLSFKTPFVQSASTLPKTEMLYDLAASDVITSDKKSMVADSFVLWKITDPLKFIQTLSGSVANAESRINAVVYNSLKTVISSMKQEAVISGICAFCLRRMTRRRKRTSMSSCARSIWREARSRAATRRWCSRLILRLRRFSADSGGRRNDALSAGGTVLARPF